MSHGSIQEHSGYWRDLWEMMFRYTSVWREDKPTWYVGLSENVSEFKRVVAKYGRVKERRAVRVMVMLCCDEKCKCGREAFDIVGEGPTLRPVCLTCRLKEVQ